MTGRTPSPRGALAGVFESWYGGDAIGGRQGAAAGQALWAMLAPRDTGATVAPGGPPSDGPGESAHGFIFVRDGGAERAKR